MWQRLGVAVNQAELASIVASCRIQSAVSAVMLPDMAAQMSLSLNNTLIGSTP